MTIDRVRLLELAKSATPGPWAVTEDAENGGALKHAPWDEMPAKDIAFIAAANPATVIELVRLLDAQQARIDALMLEFCPDEMTEVQLADYAAAQVVAEPSAR